MDPNTDPIMNITMTFNQSTNSTNRKMAAKFDITHADDDSFFKSMNVKKNGRLYSTVT